MEGQKKTKGKQKIEIKKIEKKEDKLIAFSKRKSGIYKKASELATLCDAEVGFLVFSPAGTPFSFGTPSFEAVANRFLNRSPPPPSNITQILSEAQRKTRIKELTQQCCELVNQLEAEKECGKVLSEKQEEKVDDAWWETPIEKLNTQELQHRYASFEKLRIDLQNKIKEKLVTEASTSMLPLVNPGGDEANPFATKENEIDHSTLPPEHDFGHRKF